MKMIIEVSWSLSENKSRHDGYDHDYLIWGSSIFGKPKVSYDMTHWFPKNWLAVSYSAFLWTTVIIQKHLTVITLKTE